MRLFRAVLLPVACVLAGCSAETSETAKTSAASAGSATAGIAEPVAQSVNAAIADERVFTREQLPERCALLTTEDVSAATGVPVSAITQRAISGCLYSWDAGATWKQGSVMLTSVQAHKNLQRAQREHARRTRDVTAAEVGEAKENLDAELAEKRAEGELTRVQETIASNIAGNMPEKDMIHQALASVGNEAAIQGRTVYVRYGNLTIRFGGQIDDADQLDPAVAAELGRRIVARLQAL